MHAQASQTILIVEDESRVRTLWARHLGAAGYTIIEASSPDEAVSVLGGHEDVDLLFSDIDLPGSMDRLQLAAFVRSHWPDVRLLLTSGQKAMDRSFALERGECVARPWSGHGILDAVATALQ